MTSHDFKSNSSLHTQNAHLTTGFPRIISYSNLLKISAKAIGIKIRKLGFNRLLLAYIYIR